MKPELLSPAGDRESLLAALCAGADAVYLGGPRFSARAYATNFTDEDLAESIRQCHQLGVKLYITINTLLKDSELDEAYRYAVKVWNMGVDAIIIQDTGLIKLLNLYHPAIELHASTQMTVHNLEGANYLKAKGLTRLVLARELTLSEIKEISQVHETEVFIHGALCISYSGKCLMSSMLGGRSGNRGRCAQNCRLDYQLVDENDTTRAEGYLMSPKDLSTLDIERHLAETGTASFKIEGRMKRPEYVFETVRQYKRAMADEAWSHKGITQLFNREGHNHAFLLGNDGKDMMAWNSPKNSGVALGRIRAGKLKLQTDLSLGDGVLAGDCGFIVTKIRVEGREVKTAQAGDTCDIFPRKYHEGDMVIKTNDSVLIREIQGQLKKLPQGNLPISVYARFIPGEPLWVGAKFRDKSYEASGEVVQVATGNPVSVERIRENLAKTGGTPFQAQGVEVDYEPGFIPMASLNELRRRVLIQAETELLAVHGQVEPVDQATIRDLIEAPMSKRESLPLYFITLSSKEQLRAFFDTAQRYPDHKFVPVLFLWHRQKGSLTLADAKALDQQGISYWIRMPEILKSEFTGVVQTVDGLANVSGLITDNFGVIQYFKHSKLPLVGDYKLNLLNSGAILLFNELSLATVSEELNQAELTKFAHKDHYVHILYGRTELMLSEYCPIGATVGGRSHNVPCSVPCQSMDFVLKDKKGEEFPIQTDLFCRSYIMNGHLKNNLDQQAQLKKQGFGHFRADLSLEDYAQSVAVITALIKGESLFVSDATRGHFNRGIE